MSPIGQFPAKFGKSVIRVPGYFPTFSPHSVYDHPTISPRLFTKGQANYHQ